MTTDDILRMAREAGMDRKPADHNCRVDYFDVVTDSELERFAALVAAAKREAIQNPQLTDGEMDLVITEIGRFDREEIGFNGLTAAIVKIAINSAARGTK